MADVQIAVGFGGEPRMHSPVELTADVVGVDDLVNEVEMAFGVGARGAPDSPPAAPAAGLSLLGFCGLSCMENDYPKLRPRATGESRSCLCRWCIALGL